MRGFGSNSLDRISKRVRKETGYITDLVSELERRVSA
ncbi:unnamed protein product, partial [marine sediment metagenome]